MAGKKYAWYIYKSLISLKLHDIQATALALKPDSALIYETKSVFYSASYTIW